MYPRVLTCIASDHNWSLLGLAFFVCGVSSYTFVVLARQLSNAMTDRLKRNWFIASACAAGGAMWTTHFLSMLAFAPAISARYDIGVATLSLAVGIAICAAALHVGRKDRRSAASAGGTCLALAVVVMHHVGMAGYHPAAIVSVDWHYAVIAAIACLPSAVATFHFAHRDDLTGRVLASFALIATIAIAHFGAMAGMTGERMKGARPQDLFAAEETIGTLKRAAGKVVEAEIACGGQTIPVEAALHQIDLGSVPATAIALRDLRATKAAEDEIRRLADSDVLTALPNRRQFYRELSVALERARGGGEILGVLCLDLDRLKRVNDLFGHHAGDRMLERFADILQTSIPEGAFAARLGGDEFAVAIPGLRNAEAALTTAAAIHEALTVENGAAGHAFELSTSIGIALCPAHGQDEQSLLTAADIALYRAKSRQRGSHCLYEPEMGCALIERRQMEHDLKQAVAKGQLALAYQPQFAAHESTVSGYEALVRWNRPGSGEVSPTVFIPLAEQCGAILEIGEWVLSTACAEAARWNEPATIAVNVSAVQITSAGFVRRVHEILLDCGLSPRRLHLEITETALISDFDRAMLSLRQLKAMGVSIVIDDFGTGYSSLAQLQAFPFDKIKIDRSFVRKVGSDPKAATIVRAVLDLRKGLGVPVLAEGVETLSELSFLQEAECDEIQGFLVGRPTHGPSEHDRAARTNCRRSPDQPEDRLPADLKTTRL